MNAARPSTEVTTDNLPDRYDDKSSKDRAEQISQSPDNGWDKEINRDTQSENRRRINKADLLRVERSGKRSEYSAQ